MPDPAPPGILPLFLRGVTAEQFGFKTGEGITDLVDSLVVEGEDYGRNHKDGSDERLRAST